MVQQMESRAQLVAEHAKSVWHQSGPHPYETGEYVSQIKGEAGLENGIAVGRVNAYKFTSHWIEYGTSDTPAFAPLRRGAESAGLPVYGGKRSGFFHAIGKLFS